MTHKGCLQSSEGRASLLTMFFKELQRGWTVGSGRPFSEGWVECELQDHTESLAVFHCPHIYTKKNLQDLNMASVSISPSVL